MSVAPRQREMPGADAKLGYRSRAGSGWKRDGIQQGVGSRQLLKLVHGWRWGCWLGWLQRAAYAELNAAYLLPLSIGQDVENARFDVR